MKRGLCLASIFVFLVMAAPNVQAQGNCFTYNPNPLVQFGGTCTVTAEGGCPTCGECKFISFTNLLDCQVEKITISSGQDTCFATCGEISKLTHAIWERDRENCKALPQELTPYDEVTDMLEPAGQIGSTIYIKVCAVSFPITLRVEFWCDGSTIPSCIQMVTVN